MTISATAIHEAFSEHSGVAWHILLDIEHPDMSGPLRFVNSRSNVVSNGNTYVSFPFEIVLPDDDGENPQRATLKIDNISREVYAAIWALDPSPIVRISVVLSSQPDVVEYQTGKLYLGRVTADEIALEGELMPQFYQTETWPSAVINPARFPGLW
jgi:hypothetical protein